MIFAFLSTVGLPYFRPKKEHLRGFFKKAKIKQKIFFEAIPYVAGSFSPLLFLSVKKIHFSLFCLFGFLWFPFVYCSFLRMAANPHKIRGPRYCTFWNSLKRAGKDAKGGKIARIIRQKIWRYPVNQKNKRDRTSKNRLYQYCPFVIKEKATWCNTVGIVSWAQNIRMDGYRIAFEYCTFDCSFSVNRPEPLILQGSAEFSFSVFWRVLGIGLVSRKLVEI